MKNHKRFLLSLATALVTVAITAGVVLAVWSANGSGSGGGAATIAQGLTVTAVTPSGVNASLYPGGPAGPVQFTVGNPNPYNVTLTHLSWGTPTSNNPTACPNANITLDPSAPTSASISIPAGNTTAVTTVNNVLDLAHSAPDGCQGVSFTVPITVTGTQQ
jgi:hypothetical protein